LIIEEEYPDLTKEKKEQVIQKLLAMPSFKKSEVKKLINEPSKSQKVETSTKEKLKAVREGLEKLKQKIDALPIDSLNVAIQSEEFFIKGCIEHLLNHYSTAIEYFNKVIETKCNVEEAYYEMARTKYQQQDYAGSVEDYKFAIKYECKNIISAYNDCGAAQSKLRNYEDAIINFSEAIKRNGEKSIYWRNRGLSYTHLGKYDNAIKDFSEAIKKANSDDKKKANLYNFRGFAKFKIKRYDEAIKDFDVAISLNDKYYRAYCNRGETQAILENYDAAIKDYSKAIKINKIFADAYYCRAIAKYKLKNKRGALIDFENAFQQNKDVLSAYIQEDNFDEEILLRILDCKNDSNYFYRTFKLSKYFNLKDGIKRKTDRINIYKNIYLHSIKIVRELLVKEMPNARDERDYGIAHYTSKKIADKLLFSNNEKFQISSITTTNDAAEGTALFQFLGLDVTEIQQDSQAFVGCFTFDAECLNQFRLYGKEDNQEATGVSMIFRKEFFSDSIETQIATDDNEYNNTQNSDIENNTKKYPIYRCVYIDPESKHNDVISVGHKEKYSLFRDNINKKEIEEYHKFTQEKLEFVNKELVELKKLITHTSNKQSELEVICKLLINLRYLVKHVAFKEEQECRVVAIKRLENNPTIKIDNGRDRMYIETNNIRKYVSKIYFAPHTDGQKYFQDKLKHSGLNIQCKKCNHPYN
jgi:tetratricopeptide (TPR) repeat protein